MLRPSISLTRAIFTHVRAAEPHGERLLDPHQSLPHRVSMTPSRSASPNVSGMALSPRRDFFLRSLSTLIQKGFETILRGIPSMHTRDRNAAACGGSLPGILDLNRYRTIGAGRRISSLPGIDGVLEVV